MEKTVLVELTSKKIKLEKGGSVQINFTNQKTGLVENVVIWIK